MKGKEIMNNSMQELVNRLNEAAAAYYNGEEIMSNFEYDALYKQLEDMEAEAGYALPDSPTQTVGAEVVDELPKVTHEYPALSLAKTKDIDEFQTKFGEFITSPQHQNVYNRTISNLVALMWKMDGSTIIPTYKNGKLVLLVTRGNGEVGSVITHNAPYIEGLPTEIEYKGDLIVRGEAVMSYSEFDRINSMLPDEEKYKNPRNLANATISMLDSNEMRKRKICFKAFELVFMDDMPMTFEGRLKWLESQKFGVVDYEMVHWSKLKEVMESWEKKVETYDFPVDGLVAAMDDCWFSETLEGTNHNPHIMRGYAFKWADTVAKTVLREIEWSASRTGRLNPVAIFDSVELEGTTVSRASINNISWLLNMDLRIGDSIGVIKANKIIPMIVENYNKRCYTKHSYDDILDTWNTEVITDIDGLDGKTWSDKCYDVYGVPRVCPICGGKTIIEMANESMILKCSNPDCASKKLGKFEHFCKRDCLNIVGMSEATIEKFIDCGIIKEYSDFFNLESHPEIADMDGFGKKSWQKMKDAAAKASNCNFVGFIHALGINNVGKGQAKLLKEYLLKEYRKTHDIYHEGADEGKETLFTALCTLLKEGFEFTNIEGFGPVINDSIKQYFTDDIVDDVLYCTSNTEIGRLLDNITFEDEWTDLPVISADSKVAGKTFVITGSVTHFKNREELKEKIESLGGKTSGSVSSKTDYLINNDVTSDSGKNKKAKELGVKIISEEDFLAMV